MLYKKYTSLRVTDKPCQTFPVIPPSTTTPPPTSGYDCDANNPCTPENIHNGNFYFPHHDVAKFVQCDAHGGCFVMHCAPGTIWDPNLNTCNHAS